MRTFFMREPRKRRMLAVSLRGDFKHFNSKDSAFKRESRLGSAAKAAFTHQNKELSHTNLREPVPRYYNIHSIPHG